MRKQTSNVMQNMSGELCENGITWALLTSDILASFLLSLCKLCETNGFYNDIATNINATGLWGFTVTLF